MAAPQKIPVARRMIQSVIDDMIKTNCDPRLIGTLQAALPLMHRAEYARHAEPRHRGFGDKALKGDILRIASLYPDWTLQQISIACDTNTARVSDALHGHV